MNEKLAITIDCQLCQVIIDSDSLEVLGVRVVNESKTVAFGKTELVDRVVKYNWDKEGK